jgi:hypothetical protein
VVQVPWMVLLKRLKYIRIAQKSCLMQVPIEQDGIGILHFQ